MFGCSRSLSKTSRWLNMSTTNAGHCGFICVEKAQGCTPKLRMGLIQSLHKATKDQTSGSSISGSTLCNGVMQHDSFEQVARLK